MKKHIQLFCLLIICYAGVDAQSIGIGTTTPSASAQLDIASTSKGMLVPRMTFVQRNAIASPATGLLIYQTDFVSGFYFYNGTVWTPVSTATNYFTALGNNIYNNNTGNVGIGTINPNQKMHVVGNIVGEATNNSSSVSLRLWGGTNNSASIQFYNDVTAPHFAGSFGFNGLSNSTWLSGTATTLNADGMGISNNAPLTKLHILGGQDAGLPNTSNGYVMLGSGTGTSPNLVIDNNEIMVRTNSAGADLLLQHDGGNIILCGNEQGGVGIGVLAGTSIPAGYLLAVDGKIISEEVKVQLSGNWPDYVFDKKYNLLSLDDLKKYISINKHLPNIPAAAEVEKNGIELGDMQKKMMEKIEELTLYILDLQKQIDELKKSGN